MVSKTGEAESITSHYLFALGVYRALYILNWIYRFYGEGFYDLIAIIAGIVQTILYCDFFYLYITRGLLKKEKNFSVLFIARNTKIFSLRYERNNSSLWWSSQAKNSKFVFEFLAFTCEGCYRVVVDMVDPNFLSCNYFFKEIFWLAKTIWRAP